MSLPTEEQYRAMMEQERIIYEAAFAEWYAAECARYAALRPQLAPSPPLDEAP